MKKIIISLISLFLMPLCIHSTNALTYNLLSTSDNVEQTIHKDEDTNGTLSFKLYLIVLLVTLPIITVALILIIPKKTDNLLAVDLSKKKKSKINLGLQKVKKDDENL